MDHGHRQTQRIAGYCRDHGLRLGEITGQTASSSAPTIARGEMSDDAQPAFTASRVEPSDECEALDDLIRELESLGGHEHGRFAASNASPRSHQLLQPAPLLNRSPSCQRLGEDVIGAVEEELRRKSSLGASAKGLTYREMRQRLRQMRYEMKLEEQRRRDQITCDCFSFIWRKSERIAPASPAAYDNGIGRHSVDRGALGVGAKPSGRYSAAPALNQLTDPEPERARQILSTPPALDSFKVKKTHSDKSVDLGAMKESMRDVLKDKYGQQSDVAGAALAVTPLRQILGPPKVRAVATDDSARTASLADDAVRRASRDAFLQRQRLSSGLTSPDSSRHSRGSSSSTPVVRMMPPRKLLAPVTPEEGL